MPAAEADEGGRAIEPEAASITAEAIFERGAATGGAATTSHRVRGRSLALRARHWPAQHVEQALSQREALLWRVLGVVPATVAVLVITSLVWGPLFVPIPFAVVVLTFQAYWLWRTMMTGIHAVKGYFLVKRYSKMDWYHAYQQDLANGKRCLDWRQIRHIVIIPNYTESIDKLRLCLDSLARSEVASQIVAVLAMEQREGEEGQRKAEILHKEYAGRVGEIFATFHPAGLVGEVAGKSSNENWAGQVAKKLIVDQEGHPIEYVTLTSCDVDTVFHPKYFSGVSYYFATDPDRYRRFWQAPILYYNNIWEVPAPLRLPHALAGLNHLGKLSRSRFRMVFPQSSYTLSLKMAHEVGYWDTDIVPEDWHMFLKCFYAKGGEVDVISVYHPMYMDGIRSKTYAGTFVNYYQQARRHAWGCSDIPYVVQQVIDHPEIPLVTRLRRAWGLIESHLLWSTQWYLVTVARTVPLMTIPLINQQLGEPFPGIPDWYGPASKWLLMPCGGTLIIMMVLDAIMRPARPANFRWYLFPFQFVQYALMWLITFFTSALPALDAQVRLALGKRMEYKVTEKA